MHLHSLRCDASSGSALAKTLTRLRLEECGSCFERIGGAAAASTRHQVPPKFSSTPGLPQQRSNETRRPPNLDSHSDASSRRPRPAPENLSIQLNETSLKLGLSLDLCAPPASLQKRCSPSSELGPMHARGDSICSNRRSEIQRFVSCMFSRVFDPSTKSLFHSCSI